MERRYFLGFHGRAAIAVVIGCSILPVCHGQDALRKEVLKLNNVTGTDMVDAMTKKLAAEAKDSKKFLAEAVKIAKEKDQPLNFNAVLILGRVAVSVKELSDAEVFYRIATDKAAKLLSEKMLAQSYGGLIGAYYDSKKYAEATRVCEELLNLKTDDGKGRIVLVDISEPDGETEFMRFKNFDPAKDLKSRVRRIYVQALAKQRKFDEALKIVDDMLKQKDDWLELELKGRVLHEAGRYEESVKVFETILQQVAKDKRLTAEERDDFLEGYRYNLASIYIDMSKIDQASEILEKLIATSPKNPSYYNDLGYILADKNMRLAEAEKLIRKALELDRELRLANKESVENDNGTYLDSLGWVLFRQKRYREAREVLQKALEDKTAQHIEIYDHLADTCLALGDVEAARQAWQKGLEVATDSRRDQELKRAVEKKLQQNK